MILTLYNVVTLSHNDEHNLPLLLVRCFKTKSPVVKQIISIMFPRHPIIVNLQ